MIDRVIKVRKSTLDIILLDFNSIVYFIFGKKLYIVAYLKNLLKKTLNLELVKVCVQIQKLPLLL